MKGVRLRNQMPDISHLDRNRLTLRMVDLFTGDHGRQFEDKALMTNMARLVDRAMVLYTSTSDHLDAYFETASKGNFSALFRAMSALEECVGCAHRAIKIGRVLAKRGVVADALLPEAPQTKAIKRLRDAIQHYEDRVLGIRKPKIETGKSTMPMPKEAGIELGRHWLPYETLASAITALHQAVGSPTR